jgi:GT2 family glycosyltransferase
MLSPLAAESVFPLFEGYFLYYEDVDIALTAHRRGARTVVVPEAVAFQEPSGRLTSYLAARNKIILARRQRSVSVAATIAVRQLLRATAEAAAGQRTRPSRFHGIRDGLRARV